MFHCLQVLNVGLIELVAGRMTNYLSFWPCSALEGLSIYSNGCTQPCVLTIDHPLAATSWCKQHCNCKNYAIVCAEIMPQRVLGWNLPFIWTIHGCTLIFPKSVFSICHTTRTSSAALVLHLRILCFISSRFCVFSWAFPSIWDGSKWNEMNVISGLFIIFRKKPCVFSHCIFLILPSSLTMKYFFMLKNKTKIPQNLNLSMSTCLHLFLILHYFQLSMPDCCCRVAHD